MPSKLAQKNETSGLDDLPDTRLERRKERQRAHIIDVAAQLFDENGGEEGGGLENTTAEMIAERADISTRTFFRYFESKLDVIYLDYRRSIDNLMYLVRARLEVEPVESAVLNASLDNLISFIRVDVNRQRLIRALRSTQFAERRSVWLVQTNRRLVEIVTPHVIGAANPEVRARLVVGIVRNAVNHGMEIWATNPRKDLEGIVRQLIADTPDVAIAVRDNPVERVKSSKSKIAVPTA